MEPKTSMEDFKLLYISSTNTPRKDNYIMDYELVNFCEFDKYAVQSYCAIHSVPESKNLGDITKVDEHKIPDFTMICGGSPCQDFSVAGKGKGAEWKCEDCDYKYNPITVHYSNRSRCPKCGSENITKSRSSLLVEWLRVIQAKRPDWGLYENVKNIIGKKFKITFNLFIKELQEYGYNTYYKVLNAKDYGIPQNRERVIVFIVKQSLDNGIFHFPEPFELQNRIKDVLDPVVDSRFYISEKAMKGLIKHKERNKEKGNGFGFCEKSENDIANTIRARCYKDCSENLILTPDIHVVGKINSSQDGIIVDDRGISKTLTAGNYNQPKIMQTFQMYPNSGNPQAGRIYDPHGICPSLDTCSGGNRMPKITENIEYPVIGASRGRNPDNPSDRTPGAKTEQRLEINTKGISNTITSVQKDNYVIESPKKHRKLTPLECFRLMGFSDEDFFSAMVGSRKAAMTLMECYTDPLQRMQEAEKHQEVSNTQLYKQAGNSIVVDVLYYVYLEIYRVMPYLFENLKLGSFFSGIGAFETALDRFYDTIHKEDHLKEGGES